MTRPKAFTLVETMIVITILLVLLALLLPFLGKIRSLTHEITCAANLHQQGLALNQYVTDNRYYPGAHGQSASGITLPVWVTRIRGHADARNESWRNIQYCPAQPEGWRWPIEFGAGRDFAQPFDKTEWGYEIGERLINVHHWPSSYGYNDWGAMPWGPKHNQKGLGGDIRSMVNVDEVKLRKLRNPAQMIAITDSISVGRWDFNIDPTSWWEWPSDIHRGGCNIIFADGHVEWAYQKDLVVSDYFNWNPLAWDDRQRRVASLWNNTHHWNSLE